MKALVYRGPRDIRFESVADAVLPNERGAIVRVRAAGICGSDLHIYDGHGFVPGEGYTVGHEAVGVVEAVGTAVANFSVGDEVFVSASIGCGRCRECARGLVILCENPAESGVYGIGMGIGGCQAELVAVTAADSNLFSLPKGVSDDSALVLTDNAPTGWFGARLGRIAPGDTVAVVGLGPVGLMAVTAAVVMGASTVYAVDPVASRRAQAVALGAVAVSGDPVSDIQQATGGRGVNVVVEAVGADQTIALSNSLAGRGGRVSVVGVNQRRDFPFDMVLAQIKCLEFTIGLCSVQHELPALLALTTSGRIDPGRIVTNRFSLADGADAYACFAARGDGVSKVVLDIATD
jgi:alcohol dehydrogenase